jgi:hypothetical protein
MHAQFDVKRLSHGGAPANRIRVEYLRCDHCRVLEEIDLRPFGIEPALPMATFIKRLTCRACGSVRAFRSVAGKTSATGRKPAAGFLRNATYSF